MRLGRKITTTKNVAKKKLIGRLRGRKGRVKCVGAPKFLSVITLK